MLFDEVEKAHPDIFNSLLQILDEGRLTDAQGRVVDFKNTVIVMTTNLGTRDIAKSVSLGFSGAGGTEGSYEKMKAKVSDELKQHFRPEFLNRVDEIVVFRQLSQEDIERIVDLMVAQIEIRLKDKDMGIELTPAAKTLIAHPRLRSGAGRAAAAPGDSARHRGPAGREDPVLGAEAGRDRGGGRRRPGLGASRSPSPATRARPPPTPRRWSSAASSRASARVRPSRRPASCR